MDEDGFISTGRPEEIASLQALQPSALQLGKLLRNMFCLVWLCGQGQRRASHPNPGETLICRRCLLRQSLTKHLCLPLLHDLPHSHSLSLSIYDYILYYADVMYSFLISVLFLKEFESVLSLTPNFLHIKQTQPTSKTWRDQVPKWKCSWKDFFLQGKA